MDTLDPGAESIVALSKPKDPNRTPGKPKPAYRGKGKQKAIAVTTSGSPNDEATVHEPTEAGARIGNSNLVSIINFNLIKV